MNPALTLAPRLAIERLRGTRGGGVLDVLAVVAFTVSAFLALTVAGGAWMFLQRRNDPSVQIQEAFGLNGGMPALILENYIILSVVACAILVVPVLNLSAAAARLGARGRARRLASLRLVGMTGAEILLMSVVETLVQAVVGTGIGMALWAMSLPAWQAVAFQGQDIAPSEMFLPWWLLLGLFAALLVLSVLSTVIGLRQVRISPLGVATQQTPRALKFWRVIAFFLALAAFVIFTQFFQPGNLDIQGYAMFAAMILVVVGAVNFVGPWVIQLIARPGTRTGSVPRLIAMRRIIDDPRGAWRNVSAVALLGMISATLAIFPTDPETLGDNQGSIIFITDMRTGAIICLAVGLLVAATSTLVNQASVVVDRADQSVAMDRAGMPRSVFTAIRRHHVLTPLVITLTISIGVGLILSTPFMAVFGPPVEVAGILLVFSTVVIGVLMTLGVAEACRPLQRRVLDEASRRND